jgi:hypothetical protein
MLTTRPLKPLWEVFTVWYGLTPYAVCLESHALTGVGSDVHET